MTVGGAPLRPERLLARLDAFARIGATPGGGVDRQALTVGDREARALLATLARARGFAVHQDAMANLFVRREGADPSLPPLLIGSHLDTQPSGGRFDGVLGVLAAFEALEALEDGAVQTERPVVAVSWTNEEGSRFAPGAMGSMAFAGRGDAALWRSVRDRQGLALGPELDATLAALDAEIIPIGFPINAYVELHIEQGPVLEREGLPIGIVTGIQGVRWLDVRLNGQAAHSGTTPLAYRRDPMAAAAEAIHRLSETLMSADENSRFTVGRIAAIPGSVNAIPESVAFSVDLRHPDAARLESLEHQIRAVVAAAAEHHVCTAVVTGTLEMAPCAFPAAIVETLEAASHRTGLASRRLMSGAYHDALFLAGIAPTAMLFVPSHDGLSHNEAEFTESAHVVAGARVLLEAVLALAG